MKTIGFRYRVKQMIYQRRRHDVRRTKAFFIAVGIAALCVVGLAESVSAATSQAQALAVPTFHCLSVYWSPEQGGADKQVSVQYRESGQDSWREGLPMRYNPLDTPECKADYRGSLVNLNPDTIALRLA